MVVHVTHDLAPELVQSVISLADRYRRWLGFLPAAAIEQMASQGRLLAAVEGEALVGYVLFDLPGSDIRIVQLCVAPEMRSTGVARLLVDTLSRSYAERRGIRLRCRRDWPANGAWPSLGFRPAGEVLGRGSDRQPLTVWWKEHSHPTLFSQSPEPVLLAAMDTDVFSAAYGGSPVVDSEALVLAPDSPLLTEQVELSATAEMAREVNATKDEAVRRRLLASLSGLRVLRTDPQEVGRAAASLLDLLPETSKASDPSLESDARMIAAAHLGGAAAYVTCDRRAVSSLGPIAAALWGIQVLLPVDLLLHARTLAPNFRYLPSALANTHFTVAELGGERRTDLDVFLNFQNGERRSQWNERIASAIASSLATDGVRLLVLDAASTPVALVIARQDTRQLVVDVLRAGKHHLGASVARQLVARVRVLCLESGIGEIKVTDPMLDKVTAAALSDEGFTPSEGVWVASVIDAVLPVDDSKLLALLEGGPPATADKWAEVEHRGWPLKVAGGGIESAIVPVRPQFAADLLGLATLTARPAPLGLSREHIYYRAATSRVAVPTRVLWYASAPIKAVVACSTVVEVTIGEADELHERHARYGVWSRAQVRGRARAGKVQAIRFRDTQLLRPVNYERLPALAPSDRLGTLQTVTRIAEDSFVNIYSAGRWP